jgi:hypothetical protein
MDHPIHNCTRRRSSLWLILLVAIWFTACEGPVLLPSGDGGMRASEAAFEWFTIEAMGTVYGGPSGPYYNTLFYLMDDIDSLNDLFDSVPVANTVMIEMHLFDSSDSIAVDPGIYRTSDMTLFVAIYVGLDAGFDGGIADVGAAYGFATAEGFAAEFDVVVRDYVQITDGTVEVSESSGQYTFTWALETADGYTIDGTYTGGVDRTL